jgi:glutamate-1-semialdehyde 2,1-aminomutase
LRRRRRIVRRNLLKSEEDIETVGNDHRIKECIMSKNEEIFNEAKNYLVCGASAGQRYNGVLKMPLYMDHADGAYLYDVDGNKYIDFHGGSGAALFGHNNPKIKEALEKSIERGFFMNYDTEDTVELAKLVRAVFPSCEKIRLANTGSEATQGAIRLARGYTGRNLVLRFEGHFHGMHENIWFNHNAVRKEIGDGMIETVPDSAGFQEDAKESVIVVKFNDLDALEAAVKKYKDQIACLIMEPISFNCGCLMPKEGFLQSVRDICTREGIVLIFDEVICGLRMRPGSAQKRFGVLPDLTTTAKAIGGGIPIALVGGKAEIMDYFSPKGPVVMSGTYTGALMSVMASVACMKMAMAPGFYDHIEALGDRLFNGIDDLFKKHGMPGHVRGVGARFAIYFGVENPEDDYDFRKIASEFDRDLERKFVAEAVRNGLWFHDTSTKITPAHRALMSAHSMADMDETLEKMDKIFAKIRG